MGTLIVFDFYAYLMAQPSSREQPEGFFLVS